MPDDRQRRAGIQFRVTPRPVEVHSCAVRDCELRDNARAKGRGQIEVLSDAHDLILEGNEIKGPAGVERAGIYVAPSAQRVYLQGNEIENCFPAVVADEGCLTAEEPAFGCGLHAASERDGRHLRPGMMLG